MAVEDIKLEADGGVLGGAEDKVNGGANDSQKRDSLGSSSPEHHVKFNLQEHVEAYEVEKTWICTFAFGHAKVPKLLTYDLKKLVQYGGILSMFSKGTIFTMDQSVIRNVLAMCSVAAVVCTVVHFSFQGRSENDRMDTESLEQLATHINAFVPFCLALYVSLTLTRWWALRTQALGRVYTAFVDVCMMLACEFPSEEWHGVREQTLKYGMASVELIVKAARDNDDLSSLVKKGLLTKQELGLLQEIQPFQRSMACWAWIMRVSHAALLQSKAPPPRFAAIQNKCCAARDGIQTIHTYLHTQLPFAYVHLISFLVSTQNIVVAVKTGVVFAEAMQLGEVQRMIQQVLTCVIVCLIYQGLLGISYMVHDPFGEDLLDFPIMAYSSYIASACDAVIRAQENCPALEASRQLLPEATEASKEVGKAAVNAKSQSQTKIKKMDEERVHVLRQLVQEQHRTQILLQQFVEHGKAPPPVHQ
eukprot:gnl/MRDRNA2_/MRDRNA2_126402_c0_seq1.p1 gnl/MRDRNA2_/MRDRNA2_126402_c0~~gnl/MRDRNA2_/MRDRNA2_126402_c0_seq1.p1  ORF type:complete len:488 (+),score=92.98 gnl/MRDRNA2_/MRDRNA2_126402_c0_seq1:42-1466(+)